MALIRHIFAAGPLLPWALSMLAPGASWGQELELRTYAQTPAGVNFIAFGYGVSSGNVLMDPVLGIPRGNDGQTFINDEPRQTLQSNWRFRWSLAYPITPSQGSVIGLGSALTRRAGEDYDIVSLAYQYSWGGGK
jgi:hypothetical protein